MIYCYTGVPGSGKSLHAMQDISDYLRFKGCPVIANFPINLGNLKKQKAPFKYAPNSKITPDRLIQLSKNWYSKNDFSESGILLVIDEAQMMLNTREWMAKDRLEWIHFFTNSRHYGYKIILCCQFLEMIDKQIRGCIEIEVEHRNFKNFGIVGWLLSCVFGGKVFICIDRYIGVTKKIGTHWVLGRRHLYKLYDSYAVDIFKAG